MLLGTLPLKCNLNVHILLKDDQIEFHEIGESRKAEHAFHSDGYKIKGNGLIQTLFLENRIIPEIQSDSSFLFVRIPFLDRWHTFSVIVIGYKIYSDVTWVYNIHSRGILIKFSIPFVVIKFIRRVSPCTRSKLICICHKGGFINAMQLLCIQGLDS